MSRQKLVLFLLLIAFAGALVYGFWRSPKEQRVATLKYRPGQPAPAPRPVLGSKAPAVPRPAAAPKAAAPSASSASKDEEKVHLELLARELPRFSGFRRNIFSPIFREEVKLPPFRPLPPPPRPGKPPSQPLPLPKLGQLPPPPPPPTPEQIAESELARFTFLGFMEKNGEKTVFLSSNNEIFLAKKGSFLGSKFQVTGLTDDAITIKSLAAGREIVIPLVENRSLSPRRTQ